MARKIKTIKCKACGSILNPESKVERIIRDSEEALQRFYKKYTRKKK